jgi:hypothetical protein
MQCPHDWCGDFECSTLVYKIERKRWLQKHSKTICYVSNQGDLLLLLPWNEASNGVSHRHWGGAGSSGKQFPTLEEPAPRCWGNRSTNPFDSLTQNQSPPGGDAFASRGHTRYQMLVKRNESPRAEHDIWDTITVCHPSSSYQERVENTDKLKTGKNAGIKNHTI